MMFRRQNFIVTKLFQHGDFSLNGIALAK